MKKPWIGLCLVIGLLVGMFVVLEVRKRGKADDLPDEKKAALELLEEKQAGPGYFHPVTSPATPDELGIIWIQPAEATGQVDRIIRERKLDESSRGKLLKRIKEVSEPHPSRAVGGERINLARLNVALDALK